MKAPARMLARACAALCLLGPSAASAAAPPAGLSVRCVDDVLQADENGYWNLTVRIANYSGFGVFGDSLILAVTPRGAGPGGPAAVVRKLPLSASATSISAGDSVFSQVVVPAVAPVAQLEFRFHAHDRANAAFMVRDTATASGSQLDGRYPATLVRVGAGDVEMVKVPASSGVVSGAGVLLLPGEGSDAAAMLVPAARLAREGLSVVIVNAPGRGRSKGPDDFAGPASRAAALAGLDTLLRMPGVEPKLIGVWGVSRGATLALRLATEAPSKFAAVAAQSACYDLWAAHRVASPEGRAAIETAAGRDSAAWRERSPLLKASALQTPTLVYHGERDAVFPAAAAHAFAGAMTAAGHMAQPRFLASGQHELPPTEAIKFLLSRLYVAP